MSNDSCGDSWTTHTFHMTRAIVFPSKVFITEITFEWFLIRVNDFMFFHVGITWKDLFTKITWIFSSAVSLRFRTRVSVQIQTGSERWSDRKW